MMNAMAQKFETQSSTDNQGYTYETVKNDQSGVRVYTLKNGLKVSLAKNDDAPRIQTYIPVRTGSNNDPSDNTGLAHYLEHMVFKGTSKLGTSDWTKEKALLAQISDLYEQHKAEKDPAKKKALYKKIDEVSQEASKYAIANEYDKAISSLGATGTNAHTWLDETVYKNNIPSNELEKWLKVEKERFSELVLRLFHTELEAVYEEYNRAQDNDGRLVNYAMMEALFPKHPNGQQTTIGTSEHLKSPSMVAIHRYFDTYYVPNNMGIILSGDFNPDEVIAKIDKDFSYMKEKPVTKYTFSPEAPITAPVVKEVVGPDAESVTIGFRLPGNKDKDVLLADLVGQVLTNGKAGLLDLNLVKKQKLLRASAFTYPLIDYGILYLSAAPTNGQTLEEVKSLVLAEIENLKKGNFDADLIPAIVNNIKKYKIQSTENYGNRASDLMDAFTSELDWRTQVAYVNDLSKIKKEDVVAFANKYLGDNYVAVLKRKGERKDLVKIEKPTITPVETNADKQSPFVKMVNDMPATPAKPVFLDYGKDILKSKLGKAEVLYVPNKDNSIYRLRFRYKTGTLNDLKLPLAAQYIQFLGTDKKSAEQISKEFYKIASSFNISAGEEYTTVMIEGLQENFENAVKLYEDLVLNAKADDKALVALKARIAKSRKDAKLNKGAIMQGLTSYALYGAKNKFNNVLTEADLAALTSQELVDRVKNLNNYEQTVIYYGPASITELTSKLAPLHKVPATFAKAAEPKVFKQVAQGKNQVLFTNYEMVQAETRWIRNTETYDPKNTTLVNVFNNYFGGGMGSLVFQTIRESKALAYSTYGVYASPSKKEDDYYMLAYVGSQADKFNDAVGAMNELLTTMPKLPVNLDLAKGQVKKDLETERITQDGIIFNYLGAQQLGLKEDIRKQVYSSVDKVTLDELNQFHQSHFSRKPYTYCLVASDKKVSMDGLKKLGEVKTISLEELFGY